MWYSLGGQFQPGIRTDDITLLQGAFGQEWKQPDRITLAPSRWLTQPPPLLDSYREQGGFTFGTPEHTAMCLRSRFPKATPWPKKSLHDSIQTSEKGADV